MAIERENVMNSNTNTMWKENVLHVLINLNLEVTHITSTHIPLANTSHMIMPNFNVPGNEILPHTWKMKTKMKMKM